MNPSPYRWWHEHVYLPMMRKLIADMQASGQLPAFPKEWEIS